MWISGESGRSFMRKWYRSPLAKMLLVIVAIGAVVMSGISLALMMGYSGATFAEGIFSPSEKAYEDTATFSDEMINMSNSVLNQISLKEDFETEGKYDPEKLVDIMEYYDSRRISGENTSGIAYKLKDLEKWSQVYNNGDRNDQDDVIVCQKADKTYYYYYANEFAELIQSGKLKVILNGIEMSTSYSAEEEYSLNNFMEMLKNGYSVSDYYSNGNVRIQDEEGKTLYIDCWGFTEVRAELAAPEGAKNILEVVNNTPELNGNLENVYYALDSVLGNLASDVVSYKNAGDSLTEGNTNFAYLFVDRSKEKVYTNRSAFREYADVEKSIKALKNNPRNMFVIVKPKLVEFESNVDRASAGFWREMMEGKDLTDDYVLAVAVDTGYAIPDIFYSNAKLYDQYAPYVQNAGGIFLTGVILFLAALIVLTLGAGKTAGDEEVHLTWFDRWKTEISAAIVIGVWILLTVIVASNWNGIGYSANLYGVEEYNAHYNQYYMFDMNWGDVCVIVFYSALSAVLFLIGYLSLVKRIKARTVWKNSLIRSIGGFVKIIWQNRSITLRTILIFGGFVLIHWMAAATYGNGFVVMLMFAVEAGFAYLMLRNAIAKDKIRKGIEKIAMGDVEYQIPLKGLRGENLQMAEMVNDIGNGLQRAVEEGMKSERLKTDLITNVSHDIKTPLTSIINYVDLLKRENIDDPKIQGYLDILEAKAQRLKVLTEDVVEASKVSSGNIKLEFMNVNLVEMLNQTIGEMSEKMDAQGLQVVANMPEEPVVVRADGRRMWRVFENIFNNVAKYAMPGTRVYADLYTEGDQVKFSLKNVSAQQLNIKAEELTERFIRGDISRSTEGSGLGLSIASTLTEMQGGTFELYLDGDLFKVMIGFTKSKE